MAGFLTDDFFAFLEDEMNAERESKINHQVGESSNDYDELDSDITFDEDFDMDDFIP